VFLPVTLSLRSSRHLRLVLTAAHGLAGAAVLPLHLPTSVRLALLMVLAVSMLATLTRRESIEALRLGARGEIDVISKVGAGGTATILSENTVLPGLVVLVLRLDGRRRTLVLLPDGVEGDGFRRLRVWLATRARFNVSA
jgi:toxin CptA